ncbi:39S ribosomal protein L21, mitochondrial-like [Asterias rubens]|uniref:39S ribosomal protein L21, mitochondrial-like n=1 Tax=Asterias rubens TaxID=7604 RepID=UPI001455B6F0|nr:39S ribosomal protein L21, mitochondrial-like [Asterias rubens]
MAAFVKSLQAFSAARKLSGISLCSDLKLIQRVFSTHLLRTNIPCLVSTKPRCLQCTGNSLRLLRQTSSASNTSVIEQELPKDVLQKVESEIQSNQSRLFAVVYVAGQQFKVTTDDLIQIQQHITADVGERICLGKILLVGSDNFSLIGKPLLSPEQVRVEATVIEKTKSQKKIVFKMRQRTRFRKYREVYGDLSVLRINSIEVAPH